MAQSQVGEIFSINDVNENGKTVMRCSRCEGVAELPRGKSYQLVVGSITKAKKHIAIHCPEIRPEANASDANLRHTLLISMSTEYGASMSKKAQSLRKLLFLNIDCLYCQLSILVSCINVIVPIFVHVFMHVFLPFYYNACIISTRQYEHCMYYRVEIIHAL